MVSAIERFVSDPSPAPLMSTAEARVALHPDVGNQDLTCASCHKPHEQDLQFAAVEACLSCHADDHSQSYKDSPHFDLWQAELAGDLLPGAGVTCATCHMPQTERGGVVTTNHNQNDTLRPNEKKGDDLSHEIMLVPQKGLHQYIEFLQLFLLFGSPLRNELI